MHTNRHTERPTCGQTDRQAYGQTGRDTGRQGERHKLYAIDYKARQTCISLPNNNLNIRRKKKTIRSRRKARGV